MLVVPPMLVSLLGTLTVLVPYDVAGTRDNLEVVAGCFFTLWCGF